MTTMCSWVMCAMAEAAGAAGAAGLLLGLPTEAGDVRRGSWAVGWGGRCNVGGVTLASRALHALHRPLGSRESARPGCRCYLYDHCHHTPPRQQHSLLVDAPSSCPHTAPRCRLHGFPSASLSPSPPLASAASSSLNAPHCSRADNLGMRRWTDELLNRDIIGVPAVRGRKFLIFASTEPFPFPPQWSK
jgi:hypothetical protein